MNITEEREMITRFDPEEQGYCSLLLDEIERLQLEHKHNIKGLILKGVQLQAQVKQLFILGWVLIGLICCLILRTFGKLI